MTQAATRKIHRGATALFVLAAFLPTAQAASFSTIYSFGDSLSDVGNAYIATLGKEPAAPYVNGHFSNGQIWVQDLSASLGLGPVTPSLAGGNDFAVGGAETGTTPVHTAGPADLGAQLFAFQAIHAVADPNALYTLWIGSNDLADLLASNPNAAQAAAGIGAAVTNEDNFLSTLSGLGARNLLIVSVPDLGKAPGAIAGGSAVIAAASALSAAYDTALESTLPGLAAATGLKFDFVDAYSLIDSIVASPGTFGLNDVTDPCLVGAVNYAGGSACTNSGQYLFWDNMHPTAAGHTIVANAALKTLVPEPASLSLVIVAALAFARIRRTTRG